jgi:hypothetical protein
MSYPCPVCQVPLTVQPGTKMNPRDGVTLWCLNRDCAAQEVMGHGRTDKEAFSIVRDRLSKSEVPQNEPDVATA